MKGRAAGSVHLADPVRELRFVVELHFQGDGKAVALRFFPQVRELRDDARDVADEPSFSRYLPARTW